MRWLATVRVRVTLAAMAVLAVAITLASVAVVIAQRTTLRNGIEENAILRMNDVVAGLTTNPTTLVNTDDDSIVQVVGPSGDVIAHSRGQISNKRISDVRPSPGTQTSHMIEHLKVGDGKDYQVVSTTVALADGNYTVYVAAGLDSVTKSTYTLIELFVAAVPLLVLVAGATTWVVSGRALQPVTAIRHRVESIKSHDLHLRVPEPGTSDEIGQLARTMNAMLARLQESAEKQQRFVSDASHELRSPLTAIRTRLEVDLGYADGSEWRATAGDVLEDTLRLQRLVEDLLALARSDDDEQLYVYRAVDLDEIVLQETSRLKESSTRAIDTSGVSGGQVIGDRDGLIRVIRNVLENADRHATSTITISLVEMDNTVKLSIADDGNGVVESERQRIFERFTRLDEARARDDGGSGLGLAIAKEIVDAHGGSIHVTDGPKADGLVSASAGATFILTLPAA